MKPEISIRSGKKNDVSELQRLFVDTISCVCKADYNIEQINAWKSTIKDKDRWYGFINKQYVLIAQDKAKIIGFCTLDKGYYIDFLYVHKDYQNQGIAYKLYSEIEKEAKRLKQFKLTSSVSITAKSFFEKVGFKIIKQQNVLRHGVKLTNFSMEKQLIG